MNGMDSVKKGEEGEYVFRQWMNHVGIPYFLIEQTQLTVSTALKNIFGAKRPDYLLLIPRIGFLLVDVKHIKNFNRTFDIKPKDMNEYLNLEKHFNFKLSLAFYDLSLGKYSFYWITLQKADKRKRLDTIKGHDVYRIPLDACTEISLDETSEEVMTKIINLSREV